MISKQISKIHKISNIHIDKNINKVNEKEGWVASWWVYIHKPRDESVFSFVLCDFYISKLVIACCIVRINSWNKEFRGDKWLPGIHAHINNCSVSTKIFCISSVESSLMIGVVVFLFSCLFCSIFLTFLSSTVQFLFILISSISSSRPRSFSSIFSALLNQHFQLWIWKDLGQFCINSNLLGHPSLPRVARKHREEKNETWFH